MRSNCFICVAVIFLTACSPYKIVDVPSVNQNSRIDYIVIHATSQDFEKALNTLTKNSTYPVSSHYLIPNAREKNYLDYFSKELAVYRLVDEVGRAWHAGVSSWSDEVSLNDRSIGIEVVNEFHCDNDAKQSDEPSIDFLTCDFLPYPAEQIDLLKVLLLDILDRYPDINPVDVVGHADIAPSRKSDPGPYFPWKELYESGIGAWYDQPTYAKYNHLFNQGMPSIEIMQRALIAYGYPLEETGIIDEQTRFAIRAFQLHFRSSDYSGKMDAESLAILFALVEKYRSEKLNDLVSITTN
ncbi:MAG: N-acetylmuramoyl-L-alanine amidase [Pseudomonadota bacterium]|nr:N-acetylmuramoyl-L-alanine amidase [Pseudomonadota bacterium]